MLDKLREAIEYCHEAGRPIKHIELNEIEWERLRHEHNTGDCFGTGRIPPSETWVSYHGIRIVKIT